MPDADLLMKKWTVLFPLLPDPESLLPTWRTLIVKHDVKGKPAHDARLVAAMICLGIRTIVTFNTADFGRFTEVKVCSPDDIVRDRFVP